MTSKADNQEYVSNMDGKTLSKAMTEMGENPEDRVAALQSFREWVDEQKHWLRTPTDPNFLMSFLRLRKFSQVLARKSLVDYWTARKERPTWFSNVDTADPVVQRVLGSGALLVLPSKDKEGRTILITRTGQVDISGKSYSPDDLFKGAFAVADYLLLDENTQVNGFISLADFTGFSLGHLNFNGSGNTRQNAAIWSKVYPIRVKEIHHYNIGKIGEIAFSLSKPFLPQKVQKRIFNHSYLPSLYEQLDMSLLPDEYLPDDYDGPRVGPVQSIIETLQKELIQPHVRDYIKMLSSDEYGIIKKYQPPEEQYMQSYRKVDT